MMYAQSNGSNATPGTVSSTACYDPLSKCIKLPSSTSDCGAILEGSILEIETPPFQPGKLLLGEIIEIVILDENMTPIAVFDESTSGSSGAAAAAMPASDQLSREELLEKQREQQQVQFQQSQELMQRHQEERQTLDEYERQGRLSPSSKAELAEEMEETHNTELRELQDLQQREQAEMVDLVFQSASASVTSQDARGDRPTGGRNARKKEPAKVQSQPREEKNTASRWNTAATAGTMNNHQSSNEPTTPGTPVIDNTQTTTLSKEEIQRLRREEVQTVMKDHSLGREEKQKRLADIKAKYAAMASAQAAAASNKPASVKQAPFSATGQSNETPAPKKPMAGLWKRAGVAAISESAFNKNFGTMKAAEGSNTSMSVFIQKVKSNSPSLTTIVLDGRKGVSSEEWEGLFSALEDNSLLTHLSASNCGLDDETIVSLVLALVENETLIEVDLSNNRSLSSSTGKSLLKVLKQSNAVLKKLNLNGTKVSSKTLIKIQDILDDRDDVKRMEKVQAQRQVNIKSMLAFAASDAISPASQRLSQRLLAVEKEDEAENAQGPNSSGGKKGKKTSKKKGRPYVSSSTSNSSVEKRKNLARSTAQQMATLGGDTAAGKSIVEMRAGRKLRGECEDCGQKLFQKTPFKTTPLNFPGKVKDGRCLVCK